MLGTRSIAMSRRNGCWPLARFLACRNSVGGQVVVRRLASTLNAAHDGPTSNAAYDEMYKKSMEDPESFWGAAAEKVEWSKRWDRVLAPSAGAAASQWFPGARLNITTSMLDRHIDEGLGESPALVFDSPLQQTRRTVTYADLLTEVSQLASLLLELGCGYEEGKDASVVLIYMPNGIEAVVAMLACARVGATHSVVFGGFAAEELAKRIAHAKPRVVLAASCGLEPKGPIAYKPLLDHAIELVGAEAAPKHCVIFQRAQSRAEMVAGRDLDWTDATATGDVNVPAVQVPSSHPLYVLYTSGTTASPKGIVRDTGGYAVALSWSMQHLYGCGRGDIYWAASDVGWVVGHSYIAYGPLLAGCTSVIYEGKPVGTPDAGAFWRMIEEHKVNLLFCAPTALRAIEQKDPRGSLIGDYDLSSLRTLFLAGERADGNVVSWAQDHLRKPVIDHYWQTETGWPIVSNYVGDAYHRTKPGSSTKPVPGYDLHVLDDKGQRVPDGSMGTVCLRKPLPPGCLTGLWKDENGMKEKYFTEFGEEYYNTGDSGHVDEHGYVHILTRTGDIVNVAGHRLSTGSLEEAIASEPSVVECAVVGAHDAVKGQTPFPFLVLSSEAEGDTDAILSSCCRLVREKIGAIASFHDGLVVEKLPKTRSGKILRRVLQALVDGSPYSVPATIDDPAVINTIAKQLQERRVR